MQGSPVLCLPAAAVQLPGGQRGLRAASGGGFSIVAKHGTCSQCTFKYQVPPLAGRQRVYLNSCFCLVCVAVIC